MSDNRDQIQKAPQPQPKPLENKPKLEQDRQWQQTTRNPNTPEKKP